MTSPSAEFDLTCSNGVARTPSQNVCGLDLYMEVAPALHGKFEVSVNVENALSKLYLVCLRSTVKINDKIFEESFHPWSFHETIIVAEANLSELTSVSLKITMDRFNVIDLEAPKDNKNTATFSLDDAEIHFSKDILALHSPFFEEMLKENKETYKLANFDLASFRLVLLHMCAFPIDYTRFPLDEELFREVFDVAERFQCNVMKHAVETYLLTLDSNNIKNWLSMADQFGLNRLTHKIVKSMTKDDIAEMPISGDVTDLYSKTTLSELFTKMQQLLL